MDIIPTPTWRDIVDILFLSLVAYQLFVWFRGTRALRVLIGLVVLGLVYSLAKFWGLFMTTWAFQVLWQVLVILLLILFQAEIRQVLEKVSPLRYLRTRRHFSRGAVLDELARAVFDLAQERIGAILVLTREDDPGEFVYGGETVMAAPSPVLIKSIFNPQAPAHDGAVVLSGDRLTQMGAVLPLTEREDLPEEYGTRHRAALGLCERTDAVCLVVSEERGEVTWVVGPQVKVWESPEPLAAALKDVLGLTAAPGPTLSGFMRGLFVENWGAKLGALALVVVAWLAVSAGQGFKTTVTAPVHYLNLPPGLTLAQDSVREVSLSLSGPRRQVAGLEEGEVKVRVDLSTFSAGPHQVKLTDKDVDLPLGLTIERVRPQNIVVNLKPPTEAAGPEETDAQ